MRTLWLQNLKEIIVLIADCKDVKDFESKKALFSPGIKVGMVLRDWEGVVNARIFFDVCEYFLLDGIKLRKRGPLPKKVLQAAFEGYRGMLGLLSEKTKNPIFSEMVQVSGYFDFIIVLSPEDNGKIILPKTLLALAAAKAGGKYRSL